MSGGGACLHNPCNAKIKVQLLFELRAQKTSFFTLDTGKKTDSIHMGIEGIQRIHKRISDIIRRMEASPSGLRFSLKKMDDLQKPDDAQKALGISRKLSAFRNVEDRRTYTSQKGKPRKLFSEHLNGIISDVSNQHRVSPHLTRAVIQAESGGLYNARSAKGALGLMQLMPSTARQLGVEEPLNPKENISGGLRYLKQLAHQFQDLDLTLAAYNAGPGTVKKYGGVPPYKETVDYIQRVRKLLP